MKIFCLSLFTALLCLSVTAQVEKGSVFLKNGTILKGKFNYFSNDEKLRVESLGNVWVFNAAEIDSVTSARNKRVLGPEVAAHNIRWFFRTEAGILAGNSENSQSAPFSLTASVNYSISRNFSVGVGTGVEFLKESYLPVFLNAEYRFRKTQSTPYVFLKGGYQVPLEESRTVYNQGYPIWSSSVGPGYYSSIENMDACGGILLNPGIGYMNMFSPGFGMSFAFGYQFHRLHYKGDNDYGLDIDYNRLSLKIGIIFN
ncbi:MAG: hypothetical protein EOM73_11380 [Bacteroidia bacterium]|nr:hypothetical protein [Bacteroidia bacterium]